MRAIVIAVLGPLALAPIAGRGADGPAAAPSPPTLTFTGAKFPPPGSPADQALLGEMLGIQRDTVGERTSGLRTVQGLAQERVDVRLAEAARTAPADARSRLEALRGRLVEAWTGVNGLLAAPWPVDPRLGCRERGIELEVLLPTGLEGPSPRLDAARESARRCLARQQVPLARLREANAALRGLAAEARAALAEGRPPAAGGR